MGNVKFHIVIPTHNRVKSLESALMSLFRQTFQSFQIYVIDDGSDDATPQLLSRVSMKDQRLTVIRGDGHLWWGGAVDRGIREVLRVASVDDVIVLMNDDVTVRKDYLQTASELMGLFENTVIGPLVLDRDNPETICFSGSRMVCWPLGLTEWVYVGESSRDVIRQDNYKHADFLGGKGTLYPVSIIRRIGSIDAEKLPHYHADGELSCRARRSGYRVIVHSNLNVFNEIKATGPGGFYGSTPRRTEFLKSLFSFRSPNYWRHRYNFAVRTCPAVWLPIYLAADTARLLVRGLLLSGERTKGVARTWMNYVALAGERTRRPNSIRSRSSGR